MRILVELISLVNKHRHAPKALKIIGFKCNSTQARLYDGVSSLGWQDDRTAQAGLQDVISSYSSYSRAKNQLRDTLLDALFFLPPESADAEGYEERFFQAYKLMVQVKMLLRRDARRPAILLAERVIKEAEEGQFTLLGLEAASMLRHHYATIEGNRSRFEFYKNKTNEILELYKAELESDIFLEDLYSRYARRHSLSHDVFELAQGYEKVIEENPYLESSLRLQHRLRMVRVIKWNSVHEYEKTIEVSREAVHFLKAQGSIPNSMIRSFLYQIIVNALQLQRIRLGKSTLQKLSLLVPPGSTLALRVQELHFNFAMHTGAYEEAVNIFTQVQSHRRFNDLYPASREIWNIYRGYLYLLGELSHLDEQSSQRLKSHPFRMQKLLNETGTLAADKKGLNSSIFFLQCFLALLDKNDDLLFQHLEALRRYASRYLKTKDANLRSYYFAQVLTRLPDAHYSSRRLKTVSKHWEEQLRATPIQHSRIGFSTEVLPYEVLLDGLYCILEKN
jgi:hypothetical protein